MFRILMMVLRNLFFVPGAWLRLCRYARNPDAYSREEQYRHIQYILQRAIRSGNVRLTVSGQENIPQEGGFMFYSNHQGMFDILAICATCDRPFSAVLKKELANIPFLKQITACTYSLPMDREDVRQSLKVIQQATEDVKAGRPFLIFPEGTRSRSGNQMLDFHGGSFRCATKSKCPIVPIALLNCYSVLDTKGIAPVDVEIHYLPQIPYEQYQGMTATEVAALVKSRISEKITQQLQQ